MFINLRYYIFRFIILFFDLTLHKDIRSITKYIDDPNVQSNNNQNQLALLIRHVRETVPYYKSIANLEKIVNFPIINKTIIRNNFHSFISDKYKSNQLVKVVTSGSTGTPFEVYQDRRKKKRNTADTIVFSKLAGYQIGQKLYYLKIWNHINAKSTLTAWLQNIVPVDVTHLSVENIKNLITKFLHDNSIKSMIGYVSAFESLSSYLLKMSSSERGNNNCKVIITISEGLGEESRYKIRNAFQCNVVSRYSNVENGILAQQLIDTDDFLINTASYIVEIFDIEKDEIVKDGDTGRIVITDLYNFGMPMIRYDTGDLGSIGYNDKGQRVLKSINGRKMDAIYHNDGHLISSFTITNNMWKYPEIIQYQFIQTGRTSYRFKLNTDDNFDREEELIKEFMTYLGEKSSITIEYVKEIPLLSSGKRRKVVQEYY